MSRTRRFLGVLVVACVAPTAMWLTGPTVRAGSDDIAGTVRGPQGPEAGVWVIAETTNLPSKLTKIVVTDAGGKYVLPDLPSAGYDVWVRGYGLADSEKKRAKPGDTLAFTVKQPASPQEAASIYPSNYWYSLLQIPEAGEFPGTGQGGNGIAPGMRTQAHWIH